MSLANFYTKFLNTSVTWFSIADSFIHELCRKFKKKITTNFIIPTIYIIGGMMNLTKSYFVPSELENCANESGITNVIGRIG